VLLEEGMTGVSPVKLGVQPSSLLRLGKIAGTNTLNTLLFLFEYHQAVVPFCGSVRPVRSLLEQSRALKNPCTSPVK